ncbi:unnamed protein product [Brachionus calyciflorus]|uniref:DUF5745 domain-containing protein n=1 Tax=Brachionus calyciflorus TaxID=104777 RepID=A0A813T0H9_9BILA|nr:unnamed protein product [Brachionus calyciflorus]
MSRISSFNELSTSSFSTLNSTRNSQSSLSVNSSIISTRNRVIKTSNELLLTCQTNPEHSSNVDNLPKYISSINQINSNLFIYFYECILGTPLLDKKYPAKSLDDEIHNVQSIIDSLSMDILHEDLSHIQANAICSNKPDLLSLEYLLDIMKSIQEWISSRLDSISTASNLTKSHLSQKSSFKSAKITPRKSSNNPTRSDSFNKITNRNLSRDRSTTLVSSLHSSLSLTKSQIKTPVQTPIKNKNSNLTLSGITNRKPLFESARSSSTPRSAVRSLSKDLKSNNSGPKRATSVVNTPRKPIQKQTINKSCLGQDSILSSILDDAPNTSAQALEHVLNKYSKQINWFEKVKQIDCTETKFEQFLNEAFRKQKLLIDIIKKEVILTQRLENLKRAKEEKNLEKAKKRDEVIEKARVKKYIDDLRAKEKSKMLKKRLDDELEIKKMYNETVRVKKDTLIELKKYNRDKSEERLNRQKNQIESMENYYKTQLELLNEQIIRERELTRQRENSQNKMVSQFKTQIKTKFESEIKCLQEQMYRENNFIFDRKPLNRINSDTFNVTNFCT